MFEIPNPAHPENRSQVPTHLARLGLGLAAFMVADFIVIMAAEQYLERGSVAAGLSFAVVTAITAAVIFLQGHRWFAAGLVLGFAVMTVVTGGVCTLFPGRAYGEFGGMMYLLIAVLVFVAAGVARMVSDVRRSGKP